MNPLMGRMSNNGAAFFNMLRSMNPEAALQQMLQNNPRFREFYNQNKGKPVSQICQEYGIDERLVRSMMR